MKEKGKNAVVALLGEYEKAILELQDSLEDISTQQLVTIVDLQTTNPDCKSIQTIVSHVVSSGYSYCVYIQNSRGIDSKRPDKILRFTSQELIDDLNKVLEFTQHTFVDIYDHELEVFETSEKIKTSWEQFYDIEQMMEHAIVHVLRHRRQVEKFKMLV